MPEIEITGPEKVKREDNYWHLTVTGFKKEKLTYLQPGFPLQAQ